MCNLYRDKYCRPGVCMLVYIYTHATYMYTKREDGGNEEQETGKIP